MELTATGWNQRYEAQSTGWDIGAISTPLEKYFQQLENKEQTILIPGAGNAYEAEFLFNNGFRNVFILDWASAPLKSLKKRIPELPEHQLLKEDFFEQEGKYDLIVEQTFFCAIHPQFRRKYAEKMYSLLKPGGKLVGLLFNVPLNKEHPPFGGNKEEYLNYFEGLFDIKHFHVAYNSIPPRQGRELFIHLTRK